MPHRVVAVELFRIRLPLTQPFRTARSTTTRKDALLVRVVTDDAEGWGEVGAETRPTYAPETLDTARLVLRDELVPRLFAGAGLDAVRGHHAGAGRAAERAARRAAAAPRASSLASHLGGDRARTSTPASRSAGTTTSPTLVADGRPATSRSATAASS